MDTETQRKLNSYIALFDAISEKTDSDAVAVAILQEMSKDRRARQMSSEHTEKTGGEPATARQKGFMRRLGIEFPAGISKAEASALIDAERARNGE